MMVFWIMYVFVVCSGCTGYQISECGRDGKVDLDETRPTVLTCTGITDGTVYWNVSHLDGSNFYVATCTPSTSPCSSRVNGFDAKITEHNTSTLTVTLRDRTSITGMIRCGGSAMGSSSATCNIRIVHKADKVTGCSVTVGNMDWIVTAACVVDRMFASDDEYSCNWVEPTQNGNKTVIGTLSKTIFTENNKEYTRGTCVISGRTIPTYDGVYNYSVVIDPGVGLLSGPSLEIKQPGNPALLNCPDRIKEGDDVKCICDASSSSPPAATSWYVGFSNFIRTLLIMKVSSTMDGTNYTCTQYWGGVSPKSIIYTLRVTSLTNMTTQTARTTDQASIITTLTTNSVTNDGPAVSGDDVTESDSLLAIAGGVGGGIVVIIIIVSIIIVFVVVSKRRRAAKNTTSIVSPHEEIHTYANQAAVLNNDRSDDNEDADFGNYNDIIDDGVADTNQSAVGGESNYELPTRRSQVVDTNIYTGFAEQQQASTSQGNTNYELPTRRSQVVDTNIYTGLDQETETTQYQNTATQRPTAQEDTRRVFNQANKNESTDHTDYEIL